MRTIVKFQRWMLPAFVIEVIAVAVALVWNHGAAGSGKWHECAVCVRDALILGAASLYSLFWIMTAITYLKRAKRTPVPDRRADKGGAIGLTLHGIGIVFILSAAKFLLP